jgi:hypothetical protein
MTLETVKALSDAELAQVVVWVQDEIKTRTERRRQEAIATIKSLAAQNNISVSIAGLRGRPARTRTDEKAEKPATTVKH